MILICVVVVRNSVRAQSRGLGELGLYIPKCELTDQ